MVRAEADALIAATTGDEYIRVRRALEGECDDEASGGQISFCAVHSEGFSYIRATSHNSEARVTSQDSQLSRSHLRVLITMRRCGGSWRRRDSTVMMVCAQKRQTNKTSTFPTQLSGWRLEWETFR